ncbi:hypothetical protein [Candidatus Electronema sp. TJ]|uniref:hypothetical protein n=1 Tax=Candidatus Electronema sp. TJ TaxID=3401573 RepID=UPI003AA892C7
MAVLVELFGLPGSGKSFLTHELHRRLKEQGINSLDRQAAVQLCLRRKDDGPLMAVLKKFPHAIWGRLVHEHHCLPELLNFFAHYPALSALYQQDLSQSGAAESTIRNLLGAFAASCVERQLFENLGPADELILADEGFCHRFFTLYGNLAIARSCEETERYLDLLPPLRGVIFVASPAALCAERMRQRKRWPVLLADAAEDQRMAVLRHGEELLRGLAAALQRRNAPCHIYDGVSSDITPVSEFCQTLLQQAN